MLEKFSTIREARRLKKLDKLQLGVWALELGHHRHNNSETEVSEVSWRGGDTVRKVVLRESAGEHLRCGLPINTETTILVGGGAMEVNRMWNFPKKNTPATISAPSEIARTLKLMKNIQNGDVAADSISAETELIAPLTGQPPEIVAPVLPPALTA